MPTLSILRRTGRVITRQIHTDLNGWIWERKYEVDSLCYPLQLAYLLWKETGETSQFDETFVTATKEILHLWTVEQDHNNSPYRFVRDTDRKEDTLVNDGFGPDFCRDRDDLVSLSSK